MARYLVRPGRSNRAKGLAALRGAIENAAFFESDTVLLVPGVVKDSVTYEQCYERSQAEIKKLLPLAAERKIKIGIETVTMENLVLQIIVLKNAAPD